MSYEDSAGKHRRVKSHSKYYLYDRNGPQSMSPGGMPAELEAELLDNSQSSRRQFRQSTQRLRNRYS